MFAKLGPWGQVILTALICAGLIFVGFQYFPPPGFAKMRQDIASKFEELNRLEAEIAKGREAARRRAELEKLIAQKDAELASLRRILPTEPEAGQLIKWLESQASRFNLGIKSLSEASIKREDFYKEYSYTMDVGGNYHDLGRFFDVISKHDRIVNVRNVRINKNTAQDARSRSINSGFSAVTYVYVEADKAREG